MLVNTKHRLISLPSCHNFNGLENAANLNYKHGVDLLIGAACDEETQTVSRLALRWHKLYLSSAPLSTKEKEGTTIALKPHSLAGTAEVLLAVCKSLGWKEIGLIYSEETKYTAHAIYDVLAEKSGVQINVFLQTDGHLNTYSILHGARVLISFLTTADLSRFVKTLKDEAHRPLEFSIIHVDYQKTQINDFFNYLDQQALSENKANPISTARLQKLHRHVAFLRNSHDDKASMEEFAQKHGIQPSHALYKALILCDGLQLLSNYTRKTGSIVDELPSLWSHVTNTEIHGYSGPMFIGSDGVRLPYFEMYMWRENRAVQVSSVRPGTMSCEQLLANANGTKNCYEFIRSTPYGILLDDLPPYTSDCGYDNNLCSDFHVFMIAAIVFSILLIPMAIAFYLQRKEHLIQQMPWRVPLDTITFDETRGGTVVERRVSTISTARASYSSIFSVNIAEHAHVNRQKGVNYIHNSSIKVHGALYLSNCVVDSYWVVKITDFGVKSVLRERMTHKELAPNSSFDPDAIHYKYLQQAPEHLAWLLEHHEEPMGSQEGDMYQLAMCIYQIMFYMRPFSERQESVNDLANLLAKPFSTPIHPKVPEGSSFTMRLLSIVQQCWLHKPSARPTLLKVTDAVNREFGQDVKGTLIDQMIEMIDEYSANLEQIVAERTRELEMEMSKTENLLYQLLPKSIADTIRSGRNVVPEQHSSVSLLVVDVCKFTSFCEAFIPVHILETLQELYSSFDYIVQKNKAFKVENVGDAYLICSGIPEMRDIRHLREVCKISLKIQAFMKHFQVRHRPSHVLEIKMGITSGAVAAGILGSIAPRFCIFGDTVNVACRMASTGAPGKIQINELTSNVLQDKFPSFLLEERGMIDVKGKGACLTFWLTGEKENIRRQSSRSSCVSIAVSQIKFEMDEKEKEKEKERLKEKESASKNLQLKNYLKV
uniref:guanylate cyclase n=1 Tax=Caenorhabditis japonica TaxID=281687 RepID=A0A8R1DGR4_CAEJA